MKFKTLHFYLVTMLSFSFLLFNSELIHSQSLDWAQKIESDSATYPKDFTIDEGGNQYIAGYYNKELKLALQNPTVSRKRGGSDSLNLFLGKIGSGGRGIWLKTSTNDNFTKNEAQNLSLNIAYYQGQIFITGMAGHKVAIGGSSLDTNQEKNYLFLAKLDTAGNLNYLKKIGKDYLTTGNNLKGLVESKDFTITDQGAIYLTGSFVSQKSTDSFSLGGNMYGPSDFNQSGGSATFGGFLFKISQNGNFQWSEIYQTKNGEFVNLKAVSYDSGDRINAFGELEGSLEHKGQTLNYNKTKRGTFLLQTDPSGSLQWWKTINQHGLDPSKAETILTRSNGNIYLGGKNRVNSTTSNGYLGKFNSNGGLTWEKTLGTDNNNPVTSIAYGNQTLYVGGHYEPDTIPFTSQGIILGKFDTAGQSQWYATYGEPLGDNSGASLFKLKAQNDKIYNFGVYSSKARNGKLHGIDNQLITSGRTMVSLGYREGFVLQFDKALVPCYGINLKANFSSKEVCQGDSVPLNNKTATNSLYPLKYTWILPDDTLTDENPSPVLDQVTTKVKLVVETQKGCIDSTKQDVDLLPAQTISDFEYDKRGEGKVKFSPFSNGYGFYKWEFGDGETSDEVEPLHQYNENKTYTVKLTTKATENATCSTSKTKNVNITSAPPGGSGIESHETVKSMDIYPKPFQDHINIQYTLTKTTPLRITLYNNKGEALQTLVDAPYKAGKHHLKFEKGKSLSNGLYHLVIKINGRTYTHPLPKTGD